MGKFAELSGANLLCKGEEEGRPLPDVLLGLCVVNLCLCMYICMYVMTACRFVRIIKAGEAFAAWMYVWACVGYLCLCVYVCMYYVCM